MIESVLVCSLFISYIFLWKFKKKKQIDETGINPEVIYSAQTQTQIFVKQLIKLITLIITLNIILHSIPNLSLVFTDRVSILETSLYNCIGFILGIIGLLLCWYTQNIMGNSWRVGIDRERKTELITNGIFGVIRNPTYLGLFLVNIGVWLIWPTISISFMIFLYIITLEFQVRCEEDYLLNNHGEVYKIYMKKTKRYFPFFY